MVKRLVVAPLVATLCALVLVWGTTAEPASALATPPPEVVIPVAGGTATATGVLIGGCATVVGCPAAVVTTVTAGAALFGYALGDLIFGDPETDTTATPTTGTSYGHGCWSYISPTNYPACTGSVYSEDTGNDGISYTNKQGLTITFVWVQTAPGGSSTLPNIAYVTWSGGTPTAASVDVVRMRCGPNVVEDYALGVAMQAVGTSSGSVTHTFSTCTAGHTVTQMDVRQTIAAESGAAKGIYYSHGEGDYGSEAPDHKLRAEKVCAVPGGGTPTTVTAYSATFKEADPELPGIPNPMCPAGSRPTSYTVHEGDETGAGTNPILTWTGPDYDTLVEFSDCLPGGSAAPCAVRLLKTSPTGLLDCSRTDVDCSAFDPETSTTAQYQCRWGTHVVGLDQCTAVRVDVATDPEAPPGGGTDTDIINPEDRVDLGPNPQAPNTSCLGGGWGWNPIEWVLKPIKCALTWAFVPNADVLSDLLTDLQTAFDDSALGSMVDPIDAVSDAWGTVAGTQGGSCAGPSVDLPLPGWDGELQPLNACAAPMSTMATVVRSALAVGLILGAAFVVARIVARSFGLDLGGIGEGAST
jgi:hypothetical protein